MKFENEQINQKIRSLAKNGFTIAYLEYCGLNVRMINTFEELHQIIYLRDLIAYNDEEVQELEGIGKYGFETLKRCLEKLIDIEDIIANQGDLEIMSVRNIQILDEESE